MADSSYTLPVLDQDFLLGSSMRGVRFLLEYEKAEEVLQAHGVRSTIVVFGSARVIEGGRGLQSRWYAEARRFGALASTRGGALTPVDDQRNNVIATGGGPGLMAAANRGAHDVGAPTIGFNISLPEEQVPNVFTTPELTFQFHYFAMRKMHLALRARALVVFPGGFGTLDELFEVLTLAQTRKLQRFPVVLFDSAYWRRIINLEALVAENMIDSADLALFDWAETADEIWERLVARWSEAPAG